MARGTKSEPTPRGCRRWTAAVTRADRDAIETIRLAHGYRWMTDPVRYALAQQVERDRAGTRLPIYTELYDQVNLLHVCHTLEAAANRAAYRRNLDDGMRPARARKLYLEHPLATSTLTCWLAPDDLHRLELIRRHHGLSKDAEALRLAIRVQAHLDKEPSCSP